MQIQTRSESTSSVVHGHVQNHQRYIEEEHIEHAWDVLSLEVCPWSSRALAMLARVSTRRTCLYYDDSEISTLTNPAPFTEEADAALDTAELELNLHLVPLTCLPRS